MKEELSRAGSPRLPPKLIGTWRLLSAEDYDPTTKKWVPYAFGNPPSGVRPEHDHAAGAALQPSIRTLQRVS